MNLLRFQSVFALFVLFILFGYDQVTSAPPSNMTEDEQNLCASSCSESLKEQIQAKAQDLINRDNEIRDLRKRLLDLSDYRDHIKSLNQHIEVLSKTNEILRESVRNKNYFEQTEEDLKVKTKDLNECMANQDNLKKEIEIERKSRTKMEQKFKSDMENFKKENDRIINELETKSKRDFAEYQNQLLDNNQLIAINSRKIIDLKNDLVDCKEKLPKTSCKGLSSGIYKIAIPNLDPFPALCNGDIADGGWIVMQKRFDGSEDFYRKWSEYRKGFGKLDGEFFIGLENLYRITNSQRYELYIHMESFDGKIEFARYDNFRIGNESEKYKLQSVGDYSGTDEDYLKWDVGAKFSTYDQDNDEDEYDNIAENFHGSWWYNSYYVANSNLNGRYYKSFSDMGDAMYWRAHLKSVQMLIRPKSN